MCWEVATAEKLWPAVTAVASSPGGRLTCQSLLAAQLSKGRYMIVLGASLLDLLPYITPCRTSQSLAMTVRYKQQQQQPLDRVICLYQYFVMEMQRLDILSGDKATFAVNFHCLDQLIIT